MDNVSWFRLYTIGLYKKKKKILLMYNQLGTHPHIWTTLKSLFGEGRGEESVITESALNMSS